MPNSANAIYIFIGGVLIILILLFMIFGRKKQQSAENLQRYAFAENLKYLRISKKLTIEQFAKQLSFSILQVETLEKRLNQPSMDQLVKIATYFQIEVKDLVFKNMIEEINHF